MFFNKYPYTDFHELNLDFLLKNYKTLLDSLAELDTWVDQHQEEYEELKSFMDMINAGTLPPAVYDKLRQWFFDNAFDLVGEMVKHVYFGLNDSGYFVVTIPTAWKELVFNTTGLDIDVLLQPEYGHLTISY